ncbi:amino acid deaminase/aldolase [Brevibacillus laterosporus]|uniref:amino acid deaminase/aldolase n=1 Tax=Brevibacillus laterosporus TaxID=1465 RepID=UPI000EB16A52|nr:amino acid deaminase/aldolase [Brevibacillus laterosporus]AYK07913.1 amino acid deaminase/aldolase [Brevibacillus laterosporus]
MLDGASIFLFLLVLDACVTEYIEEKYIPIYETVKKVRFLYETTSRYRYYREAFANLSMPFAYIDLDLLDQNMAEIVARSNGKRIRIASKSIRSIPMLRYILDYDPLIQGIMCFTASEALFLWENGFHNLLLGYPVVDRSSLLAIARAVQQGAQITLMVDSLEHINLAEEVAKQVSTPLLLCVEMDASDSFWGLHIGVYRSSLRTFEQVMQMVERIGSSPWLVLDGIMSYEAQIAGVGDNMPGHGFKNGVISYLKKRSIRVVREKRKRVDDELQRRHISLRFFNGGGTGSMSSTCYENAVTEVTVGSGFYAPALFDYYKEFHFQPAAGFAVEIVRQPRFNIYTCMGGGYVASGAIGKEKLPLPYLPPQAALLRLEGAGEVQTPVRYEGDQKLAIGDPIFFRHSKAGELCERFPTLHLLRKGKRIGEAITYRGEGRCFL